MKRKRYFCDRVRDVMKRKRILLQVYIIIISIIIIPISSITCYQIATTKYESEINSYFEKEYASFYQMETKIKEKYPEPIKYLLYLLAVSIGLFTFIVIFLISCIVIFIAEHISKVHKDRDMRKKFHKRKR